MKNKLFNSIQIKSPKKNTFDLSHERKYSCQMGDIIPTFIQEVIPGDSFRVKSEMLMRLAPMTAPVMHRVNTFMHYFFVPNRLVYANWENFITGGEDGLQMPLFPTITFDHQNIVDYQAGKLPDYMGIPVPTVTPTTGHSVSALPFRAYALIWNEYYRDQNLQAKLKVTKNDTVAVDEYLDIVKLQKRAWEKDYFTSCLPFAQKGNPVIIPSQVEYQYPSQVTVGEPPSPAGSGQTLSTDANGNLTVGGGLGNIQSVEGVNITINDLRKASRLQEWLEKNARGGSRYIESILSHFGVSSSNKLLQRPQYLGGGRLPIVISEVLSTFNNEEVPGANMYGHGLTAGSTMAFQHFFEEHGFIIGLQSTLPRTNYSQGLERFWFKTDKFDYAWPEFANIGEQEVLNKEIYTDYQTSETPNGTFGYQSRYAEYKFKNSSVHGDFRTTKLEHWHMGRIFDAPPALNAEFVASDPTQRIFAVTDPAEQKLYVQLYNDVKAIRPLPVFGTPTL